MPSPPGFQSSGLESRSPARHGGSDGNEDALGGVGVEGKYSNRREEEEQEDRP